ncbi:MAG: NADH-flavin reductase [Pseudonocardiales bacterium]|nr:NADH-flavin reductase [Pseudonocardiales bacterium]
MTRVVIFGGTGYAGSHIAREAAQRGHEVVSYARTPAGEPHAGVDYRTGSVLDADTRAAALTGADVVISALAPRGDMQGQMRAGLAALAADAAATGVRFGVVGGAGSLLVPPDGPRFVDTLELPEEVLAEIMTMVDILGDLRTSEPSLDWFFVSPPPNFGAHLPGEALGHYQVGSDFVLTDDEGQSEISGADFAAAFIDEIDAPRHRRARFTVAH